MGVGTGPLSVPEGTGKAEESPEGTAVPEGTSVIGQTVVEIGMVSVTSTVE